MRNLLFVFVLSAAMVSLVTGLNCIVCSSATNIICEDPYKGDASLTSSLSQSGFKSCLKTMYWTNGGFYANGAIIREGSPSPCSASSSTGSMATLHCCSDIDNCNDAASHTGRVLVVLLASAASWIVTRAFLH